MTNIDRSFLSGLSLTSSDQGPIVRTRAEGQVLVVTFTRESLDDTCARQLTNTCLGYAEEAGGGWHKQAVSLGMAHGATCAGLRALVEISDGLSRFGGRLTLFGVAPDVRSVLRRTGLTDRLSLARSAQDAVARAHTAERHQAFSLAQGFGLFRAA